jgi:beta-mannosidase
LSINISNGIDLNIKKTIQVKKGINLVEVPFSIEKPIFWYPHNYGDPYMYDTKIELSVNGRLSDSKDLALGVRELKIIQKPDSIGVSFYVEVNGTPIFCKGSNYIPSHFFNGRLKKEDYQRVIQDAKDANMNMLRVWGGAVYEKEEFYELCDRQGILIWQDFMFACNMYRGDETFLKSVEKEATQNVKRLRNHPSVALWIGNNEILRAWTEWGWQDRFALDSTQCDVIWEDYQKLFYSILDKTVKENDPGKLYWPSSPSATFDTKENHKSGDSHFWDVWFGQKPFQFYHDLDCRFVSEFGFVSYPDKSTLLRFAGGDTSLIGVNTPFMAYRQRCKMDWMKPGMNGNLLVKQYMDQYYGVFNDFSDFIYVSQLMHADAIKEGIEAFRMDKPRNMGALYWQIDDCWPTVSWSSVDFYGNWKAPHYAAKRANTDLFILGEWQKDNFVVKAGFDGLSSREVKTSFVLLDENGIIISKKTQKANLMNADNVTLYSITKRELNASLIKPKCILLTCVSKNDSVSNLYFLNQMKSFIPKSKEIMVIHWKCRLIQFKKEFV